ncbi:MAG: BcpB protein [Burkholderiales bacterium RIFCSPLOWO2_02_FULL_57_36]|nr:MAG: BcpB protein [Burkholderiales bacterium RIFCSPLOWO2_02_FULL_57_36]
MPQPIDDGGCAHLPGVKVTAVHLTSTSGRQVDLSAMAGTLVLYFYPMTGRPGVPLPTGWDQIPGARGCTPQSCSFRDHYGELQALGATVFGVSTQASDYQQEAAERLHLPFDLLSDENLTLAKALSLPMFEVDDKVLIKRLTLIIKNGEIVKVFYPVFPSDRNANEVITWLQNIDITSL